MSGMNSSYAKLHQAFYQPTRTANDISEHFRQARSNDARASAARQALQEELDFVREERNVFQEEHDFVQEEHDFVQEEHDFVRGRDFRSVDNQMEENQVQSANIPSWQRELAASQVERRSYASSVVSTRTRLSVASDDARSVEIQAGGISYRISRDGSRITDVTPPPPYSGLDDVLEEEEGSGAEDVQSEASSGTLGARQWRGSASVRSHSLELPREHAQSTPHQPATAEAQSGLRLQERLRNAIGLAISENPPRTASTNNAQDKSGHNLRRTQSESFAYKWLRPWSRGSEADPASDSNNAGNGLRGSLGESPSVHDASHGRAQSEPDNRMDERSERSSSDSSSTTSSSSQSVTSEDHRMAAISEHYHELLRNIDREHRKKLHDRDIELAKLRELLNDKDIVYRQQLRERDDTIDAQKSQIYTKDVMINDLKTKFYELGEEVEQKVEKARNTVEDVWEKRWKEREQLLIREKLGKSTKHPALRDAAVIDSGASEGSAPETA